MPKQNINSATDSQESVSPKPKMRNRSAGEFQNTLLYTKAYREIAGTVTATILFQRLEWRFSKFPDGFYKFLEPVPNNKRYRVGDSWTEELGFSVDEFRGAFNAMGIRYKSEPHYRALENPFSGEATKWREALYISVLQKSTGLTYYYRNHELVDHLLDRLNSGANLGVWQNGADGNRQMASVDSHLPSVDSHLMKYLMMAHTHGTHTQPPTARDRADATAPDSGGVVVCRAAPEPEQRLRIAQPKASDNPQGESILTGTLSDSVLTPDDFRAYAASPVGKGIKEPESWAAIRFIDHKADELVRAWLANRHQVDYSQCPDCKETSGWLYPQGIGGPVKKCKHEKLPSGQ